VSSPGMQGHHQRSGSLQYFWRLTPMGLDVGSEPFQQRGLPRLCFLKLIVYMLHLPEITLRVNRSAVEG